MKRNSVIIAAGTGVLALIVAALPGHSIGAQDAVQTDRQPVRVHSGQVDAAGQRVRVLPGQGVDADGVLLGDDAPSWLGVEAQEVTADKVKELKLPAERGVIVGRVAPDSPAAKAGLKENDVITEVNGQLVEGSLQFRRLIHEIPPGRTIQLTVWRDGASQSLTATLGLAVESHQSRTNPEPGVFSFRMPDVEIPDLPEVTELPPMEWDNGALVLPGGRPRLGIDAEDLSGQLGSFFGAPDGEGVLVRSVNPGSAAEKSGLKAGDVITSFNGERIRSLGDLRQRLAGKNDDKPAKLGVLRNKIALTLTVELPALKTKTLHKLSHSTNI
jgi:serine protease Do